jgi:hypothetical protein
VKDPVGRQGPLFWLGWMWRAAGMSTNKKASPATRRGLPLPCCGLDGLRQRDLRLPHFEVPVTLTAIHDDHFSGDVVRLDQVPHGVRHILDGSPAPE